MTSINELYYDTMKTKFILFFILLLIPVTSCRKNDTIQFTLYVNYMSSVYNCKTFKVTLDGQKKGNEQLCYEGILPCFVTFAFPVTTGNHNIKVELIDDSKSFEKTIEFVNSQKFGYLDYNSLTSEFNFRLSSTGGVD